MAVDLIVPLKPPVAGKSRLRGALGHAADAERHAALVMALASDTLLAATEAAGVRRVLVVGSDPETLSELRALGVEVVGEPEPQGGEGNARGNPAATGLNAALRAGEHLLRADDPLGIVGALQADLPALRASDLSAAIEEAAGRRAFTADRHGTGTTLLLSSEGGTLDPHFGEGSAAAHERSGATPLGLAAPSLRGDVDTAADLEHARLMGLGKHTTAVLEAAFLSR
ncbi:2-phospho-L-lactate guanylyltransferase [Saccharomonospora sp. NPDC006951]